MVKRLSTALLLAGLVGLVPVAAAEAAPAAPAQAVQPASDPGAGHDLFWHDRGDDHYRCMYRCRERGERGDRYERDRRYRQPRPRYCWYRDRWGWYQAPCRRHRK